MRTAARLAARFLAAVATLLVAQGTAAAAVVVPDGGLVLSGSTADVERGIDIAHDAGARWVSISAGWQQLEPAPDSYETPGGAGTAEWDELGEQLGYARSRSMSVELRFSNAPGWASGRADASDDPPTPANVPAYADFLGDLATRFGAEIDAYSPWNEPNRPAFWNPPDPDAFTALQKAAYTALKVKDPTATVLYGPVVGRYASKNSGYTFLTRSYQLGLKGHADAIGWNGYPGGEPESPEPVENGVPAGNTLPAQLYLRDLIDKFDPGRRVWIMEMSWSTCIPCNVSAANGVTEAQQADYLARAFSYRRRYLGGVTDKVFWFQLRDDADAPTNWFHNQGLVHVDLSPKPALGAFRALGVEVPDGSPADSGAPLPGGAPVPVPAIPASATRIGLPAAAGSARTGRLSLGRLRLSRRHDIFTIRFSVRVRGGASKVQIDGYRGRRWRVISRLTVTRSGTVTARLRDKGFLAFRVRGTLPGRAGFRVGRVLRVPPALFR